MNDLMPFAPWVSGEAKKLFHVYAAQPAPPDNLAGQREFFMAFNQRHLEIALGEYAVCVTEGEIQGVMVQTVTPSAGVTRNGVLICLHGGSFMWGSGPGALLEAVPVAATTGMKVIAVNYRLAPEHIYPAAVEDVLAVYGELLEQENAQHIGIYGCSAGGILTAQTVSRLIVEGQQLPGAIAMFHGTAVEFAGDSAVIAHAGGATPQLRDFAYFKGADLTDPLVLPGNHPDVLAKFPPSLLITGTRDFAASAVSVMHRRLLAAGAISSFVNFDGMWHAHHMSVDMPESRETFELIVKHFSKYLG
jgi:epsilon-lactone hydrolase